MKSEAEIQAEIRLAAGESEIMTLWRNNVGACRDDTGRQIRFGLGNDSAKINKVMKSSDLIGIRRTLITQDMVGCYLGVFTAIECKAEGWTMRASDQRATAQMRFIQEVARAGGFSMFATSADEFKRVMKP